MINTQQIGAFVRDLGFPGQTEKSPGISLWYAPNSRYVTTGPTDCDVLRAELPEDVDPDTVFVSMYSICSAPFNGSIFNYWTRRHSEQTVINISSSPYHSRELCSILDERYPGVRKTTRLSFALIIDICNYALQHLIPNIDQETSTAQLAHIKSATLGVLGYVVQHFTVTKGYPVTSFANVTLDERYRLSKAMCVGAQNDTRAYVEAADADQYQPYLPGLEPEIDDMMQEPAVESTEAQAELVAPESITEDLMRKASGNVLKDVEAPAATTATVTKVGADVHMSIAIDEGCSIERGALWKLLEPVKDLVTCYSAPGNARPLVQLDVKLADITKLLVALSNCNA